jgi:hypothetical protein
MNINSPIIRAKIEAMSTAAAATSFDFFANGCISGLAKSTRNSRAVLIASSESTKAMLIRQRIHSIAFKFRYHAKKTTIIAATKWILACAPFLKKR